MNQIAEVCGGLALYRVMIKIDEILDYYTTDSSLAEMEAALNKLLQNIQGSEILNNEVRRNGS